MITFRHKGNFKNTEQFLTQTSKVNFLQILEKYGQEGVNALASATPIESGETANSWGYEIRQNRSSYSIIWTNSNIVEGVPIAILIQYGHATRNGGYVQGRDFINPTMRPIFDKIAENAWREVNDI